MDASLKICILLVVAVSAVLAHPGYGHGHGHGDYYAEPKYTYGYAVHDPHTGDVKSAHESRHGGITKGSYSLVQPDGVTRTVNYVADPVHGFQADVINNGHTVHHGGHGGAHGGLGVGAGFGL